MKKVGIIGAGISGLTTAKAFLNKGYAVTIIEKAASIGGVWEKSRSYLGVTTQTTRDEYAYSDFPMPAHYPLWPSGAQVQAYLESYAAAFDISRHIRFNTQVTDLRYEHGRWLMRINNVDNTNAGTLTFDFVAICTGTFHKPYVPEYPGAQQFVEAGGSILHSSQVKNESLLKNKAVAVVGFAKSATDIATLAADLGTSCTLLYRKAQWKVPRFFGNKVNLKYLLFSRFSEAFFNGPEKPLFEKILHSIGKPLVWGQWRALEALLKMQFKLKACNMIPDHKIEDQISCALGIAPEGFYEKVRTGKIAAKCTVIDHFDGKKVVLKNGETLTPDLIIYGTGFSQSLPFLEERYRNLVVDESGRYQLYRNIVNPDIPQLGFVGFNSSLFSTLTSEVAAHWLVAYASGTIKLPTSERIRQDITFMDNWRRSRVSASVFSGTCVAPFNFKHIDQLMNDMGLPTRISRSPLQFFKPINPGDYRRLLQIKTTPPRVKSAVHEMEAEAF
ncbi:K+ transport protein [Segetibacter sp. 3557_3]|uniref:flavin-containing monooxygenase n=1 Tax=Segetibacter sp. 3557_3 TaxID=2547429 RepID=UPI001058CE7A|nr:NAD(P)/FAD-dependent oxidoreductase [Segetibacter sp. 3557_3]TDH28592.1 K+ transport protein [Segetibacter sp. 3557_3]